MKIAVVIPFRKNSNRSEEVPKLCVEHWLQQPMVSSVVFVDGSDDKLEIAHDRLVHLHVPYDGNFNLSFMRNVGVRKAIDMGFDFVQIMDSDIFSQTDNYIHSCVMLMNRGLDMLRPFVINSPVAINDTDWEKFANPELEKCKRKVYSYSTMFMRTAVPKSIHGWDEAYQIWGAEDDDFLVRASRGGYRVGNIERPWLIHSHHESDTCKKAKQETDQYQKNYDRFKKTRAGVLPNIRMPDNWGLHPKPRTAVMLRFKK